MDSTLQNISQVENFLSMALTKRAVSKNIYVGNLPAAIDKGVNDMVFIDVFKVSDYDSHGEAQANIYMYARPTGTSLKKNVKLLNKMENTLTECMKSLAHSKPYAVSIEYRDSGYDNNRNFHYNVMSVNIIIY